jgi:hypothetical protein
LLYGEFRGELGEDALEKFKNIYGIYPIENQPLQTIVIDIAPKELAYFRSFPIHESQTFVMVHNSGRARLTVNLIPSFELVRLLRSYGSNIRIIEPEWLRLEVTENRTR